MYLFQTQQRTFTPRAGGAREGSDREKKECGERRAGAALFIEEEENGFFFEEVQDV